MIAFVGWPLAAIRVLRVRPRLVASAAAACAVTLLLPAELRLSTRLLLGWNGGAALYLVLSFAAMRGADAGDIRRRARAEDEGSAAVLLLTTLAITTSFGAIAADLRGLGESAGAPSGWRLALAGITILVSWTMTQVVMATHYAGEYYGDPAAEGGLDFPGGDREPDYLDFLYFAFTMGAAAQTSDVQVTSRGMRALVLAHTILAFLFNTTILALAINVGASVI